MLLALGHHQLEEIQNGVSPDLGNHELGPIDAAKVSIIVDHGPLDKWLSDGLCRPTHRVLSCVHVLDACFADVTQVELLSLELKMLPQHVKLLIATFVLLRVHRCRDGVFGLRVSADQLELGVLALVSCSFLALR